MENSQLKKYCDFMRSKVPGWKDLDEKEMDFHLFASMTNKVFKVTAKKENINPKAVILRNFCAEEGIIDKHKERKVFFGMSKSGFGPKYYGYEEDLRIEEYIPSRMIKPHEYKEKFMRRRLARALAAIHKIEIPSVEKTPLFENELKNPDFFNHFVAKCDQDIYSEKEKEIINEVRPAADESEQEFLRKIVPVGDIVFSHNDLLQGNILIPDEGGEIRFIDYEYASYNFRGYDIGNMYRESMFDYSEPNPPCFRIVESNFPNKEELKDFLKYYIVFTDMDETEQDQKAEDLINNDESMKAYVDSKYDIKNLKERMNKLYKNTKIGAMLSFYYWLIWSVKMHKTKDTKFDYLKFAQVNYEYYQRLKDQVLNEICD